MKLEGKTAIVTGAGRGIGRAVARGLAREGCRVVLAARTVANIEDAARELEAAGAVALAVPTDVSKPEDLTVLAARAQEAFGAVDILVNNAGVNAAQAGAHDHVVDLDPEALHRLMAVNFTAVFLLTKAVLPDMLSRQSGRIINISSNAGKEGMPGAAAYCASKHAVIGFTRSLAHEVGPHGITANCICPGWVWTEMVAEGMRRRAEAGERTAEEWKTFYASSSPQNRMLEPEEIAALAVFLAGEEARGINGQSYSIDGGEVMS